VAVRRRRNGWGVGRSHGYSFGTLSPGGGLTVDGVNTRRGHIIGVANLEGSVDVVVVSKSVVGAPNPVVNVVAKLGSIGACGVAHLQAEDTTTDEVDPFDYLRVGRRTILVSVDRGVEGVGGSAKAVGEHNSA